MSEVFDVATSVECKAEAELEAVQEDLIALMAELEELNRSDLPEKFQSLFWHTEGEVSDVDDGDISLEQLEEYSAFLEKRLDLINAIELTQRAIVLLELGYDPNEEEVMDTDMELD